MAGQSSTFIFNLLRQRRVEILLVIICFIAGGYFKHIVDYDNSRSRLLTAISLVERGTWDIDPWHEQTIDISKYGDHYFSNKAIGLNLFAYPFHWALRNLTPFGKIPFLTVAEKYLLQLFGATLPHTISALLLYLLSLRWGASPRHGVFVALSYGLGSIAWQHATMFSSHTLSAACVIGSFYLVVRLRERLTEHSKDWRDLVLSSSGGLVVGLGTLTEYPVAVIALLLTVYVLSLRARWQVPALFMSGGAIMLTILLWNNWTNFGSPFELSYGNQIARHFSAGSTQGMLGISLPSPINLFRLLFLPARGLLAISPVLILMIPGAVYLWRRTDLRREWWVLVLSVAIFHLWNAGFYGWHSGWAYGSRYQVAILPLSALLLVFAPRLGWLGWFLLVVSFVQNLLPVAGIPYPPDKVLNPLVEFIVPMMDYGYWALNIGNLLGLTGWMSLVPLFLILVTLFALLWQWTRPDLETISPSEASPFGWKLMAGVWITAVILMLATIHTEPRIVHLARASLLRFLYVKTHYEPLAEAARKESELAKTYMTPKQ